MSDSKRLKIAIVAVHGVIPQQRYAFQDQVATALRDQLNAAEGIATGAVSGPRASRAATWRRGAGPEGKSMMRGSEPPGAWRMDVVFPDVSGAAKSDPLAAESPSIVRVHRGETNVLEPVNDDAYDVIEAYWSPIDKGKTNAGSVLTWLLATVFQPANTTARYEGWWSKGLSDVAYTLGLAFFALASLFVFALELGYALRMLAAIAPNVVDTSDTCATLSCHTVKLQSSNWWRPIGDGLRWLTAAVGGNWFEHFCDWFWQGLCEIGRIPSLLTLEALEKLFSVDALVRLAIGAIGAYLLVQGARAWISVGRQKAILARTAIQLRSRRLFIVALFVLGLLFLYVCAAWATSNGTQLEGASIAFVFAAFAFEGLRSVLTNFFAQFFGDVQIYCTHDENSAFFALRAAILELVERRLVDTLEADYDRVFIFAHSLGSTIALDAIMRVYNLEKERGFGQRRPLEKLRGFVTFGTALEKTRYFLDTYGTSLSASLEEWKGDYYGLLFTPDPDVLYRHNDPRNGIYWANYWYFFDFIADRIASYRSYMKPTDDIWQSDRIRRAISNDLRDAASTKAAVGKVVAQNRVSYRTPPWPWHVLHGDYLSADWFWRRDTEYFPPVLLGASIPPAEPSDAIGALAVVTRRPRAGIAPRATPRVSDRYDAIPAAGAARRNVVDVIR